MDCYGGEEFFKGRRDSKIGLGKRLNIEAKLID
ncbi:hypothetical protein Desaci_2579 [Desulfosporosinus acidiphilus SJ4]|uniref:Uncharacterized protein n=1 Tax=Desulfosporosinus acidiphilus (strain DSM 22704 / JCM 16185 / SJ4) TaxID=646529 RepID=I4D6U2_DESAJ|nr:hypothetical protein Desaci_2579 [Desulfosporosinus acidiphilus SJ4]